MRAPIFRRVHDVTSGFEAGSGATDAGGAVMGIGIATTMPGSLMRGARGGSWPRRAGGRDRTTARSP